MMRVGQRSYIPGYGAIQVTGVEQVRLEDLTLEDALREGVSTVEELRTEIEELYQEKIAKGYSAFRVRFIEEQLNPA